MDKLNLKIIPGEIGPSVEIQINGQTLLELARDAELASASRTQEAELAGKYSFIPLYEAKRTLLENTREGKKLPVLACECGETGCWPLLAAITNKEGKITWGEFKQPYRKFWDLSSLGPFHFEPNEYELELQKITKAVLDSEEGQE